MFGNGHIQSAQFMGLINALRTGDPTVDMVGAMVIPFVLQKAMQELPAGLRALLRRKQKEAKKKYTRTISYRSTQNVNGMKMDYDDDSFNLYLIRAMKMYLNKKCKLHLQDAEIDLVMMDADAGNNNNNNACFGGRRRARRNNNQNAASSTFEMLEETTLVERPLSNEWHSVGTFNGSEVELIMNDSADNNNNNSGGGEDEGDSKGSNGSGGGGNSKSSVRSVDITLRSDGGVEPINKFVKESYEWYKNELKKLDCNERFMFDVIYNSGHGYRNGCIPNYTAYKLSDEKTFETLFSKQCHDLLKTVHQFQTRSGKYAIKGYPHKLGLLLSGPPGTGKTSLIKAMAHHTGRHIVNINLSRISTNEELMLIFFNKLYQINGANPQQLRLEYEDVIFVLEDVDASSDVVMDRDIKKKRHDEYNKQRNGKKKLTIMDVDTPDNAYPKSNSFFSLSDELNLSGILNVLDGVVDTPNRMVIMTSNHPELLDPALIRPGRIDKQLVLSYMIHEDIVDMVQHYFQSAMTDAQKDLVATYLDEFKLQITPAQIEQIAVDADTIDIFLARLKKMATDRLEAIAKAKKEAAAVAAATKKSARATPSSAKKMLDEKTVIKNIFGSDDDEDYEDDGEDEEDEDLVLEDCDDTDENNGDEDVNNDDDKADNDDNETTKTVTSCSSNGSDQEEGA
mmetsp:Transcript_1760/g.4319  ORF Transcript_1760/g.4319 Transcript_1760/m.4319 type:complete len:680 (-) Transcript_1760:144-2183(-)